MKNFLLALLLLHTSASAQTIFENSWTSDLYISISDIATDAQGNIYFACSASEVNADSSTSVVVKTNSDFDIEWSKRYRTYLRDDLSSIEILSDGNILLGGTIRQSFIVEQGGSLIKIDPDGNVIWQRVYDGSFDQRVIRTAELPSGDIVSVIRYGVNDQPSSILITNFLGEVAAYYELFEGENAVQLNAVVRSNDNVFYAVGDMFDSELDRNLIFIAAFDESEAIWLKKYDFGLSAQAGLMSINSNGEIAVCGLIVDPESIFNGFDGVTLVTNDLGEVINANRIYRQGNGFSESLSGIKLKDNGSLILSMNFFTEMGTVPLLNEFDSQGALNWSVAVEYPTSTGLGYSLTLDDGRLLTTGRNDNGETLLNILSAEGHPACNGISLEFDMEALTPTVFTGDLEFDESNIVGFEPPTQTLDWPLVDNENCSGLVSTEDIDGESNILIYPNPSTNRVIMQIPKGIDLLEIFSIEGKSILQKSISPGIERVEIGALHRDILILKFSGMGRTEFRRLLKL